MKLTNLRIIALSFCSLSAIVCIVGR